MASSGRRGRTMRKPVVRRSGVWSSMLANRAHTLILQARLAISLAWVAGYVNVVAVMTCGFVVSHVTGNASTLGRELILSQWSAAALMAVLLLAFFVGAFVSGFAIELGRQRNWSSIYVLPAAIELLLLTAFAIGVRRHDPSAPEAGATLWWMTIVATLSMGVQNATITRISSGVVRTTHLTGIVTDLGHESAQLAIVRWIFGRGVAGDRARRADRNSRRAGPNSRRAGADPRGPSYQRLFLLASIFAAFVAGSASGAFIYLELPHWSMIAPIALLGWIVVQDLRTPICELEEAQLAESGGALAMLEDVAVFKAIPRGGDARETHLPDLASWVEGLPAAKRIVILDLSRARVFGPLAANALHSLFAAAARSGHRVLIAGLDGGEVATINALSRSDLLHAGNSAADLAGALHLAVAPVREPWQRIAQGAESADDTGADDAGNTRRS